MQFSGIFAPFWYAWAMAKHQPVSAREAEIDSLERQYRDADIPLTGRQLAARFALLIVAVVVLTLVLAILI